MARGSFNGLYTFGDVAKIYNMDASTIRKQVGNHKFYDHEIRKFGKTWLITEQAMTEHFGLDVFVAYKQEIHRLQAIETNKLKEEARRAKEEAKLLKKKSKIKDSDIAYSLNSGDDDDLPCDSWSSENFDERQIVSSFSFQD